MMAKEVAKKYFRDLLGCSNSVAERLAREYVELAREEA